MNKSTHDVWSGVFSRFKSASGGQSLRIAMMLGVSLIASTSLLATLSRPLRAQTESAHSAKVASGLRAFPNFTIEQRLAELRAEQSALHPKWKDLSWSNRMARAEMFAMGMLQPNQAALSLSTASFLGNLTTINAPSSQGLALHRQSDCSLSLYAGTYSVNLSTFSPSFNIVSTTPDYERILHTAAGLTTQSDTFTHGCVDPSLGIGSRWGFYLGKTSQNLYMVAGAGYDPMSAADALYYGTVDAATLKVHSANTSPAAFSSSSGAAQVAGGDLNNDGLADIVGFETLLPGVTVWLAHADGSIGTGTSYALPGNMTEAVVLADVNGDGKVDVVAATISSSGQEQISVLTGKGDGTLNASQTISVPTPAGSGTNMIRGLIAADLRGNGHRDIVASNGLVLLNNGSGAFTLGTSAFPAPLATTEFGPNLAAADFNKDGKMDLVVSGGATVNIFLGKGDGTFTPGAVYGSIQNAGYLTATDLDGDGNVDIYVGVANGGFFGGDVANQAYALMGNGDGTFRGAPSVPFVYVGTNIVDLNGDKKLDAVGVNTNSSFTSYIGDGKGGFSAGASLVFSPITLGGTVFTLNGIDSFAFGDVNGDGKPDLVYIGQGFVGPGTSAGLFIALGKGDGSFGTPSYYAVPELSPASEGFDVNLVLSNIRLADVNGDGKDDLIYGYTTNGHNSGTFYVGTAVQISNGNGTFGTPHTILFYSGSTSTFTTSRVATISDFNKDGRTDLLFLTQSSTINPTLSQFPYTVQVALGHGDGSFGTPTSVATADILAYSDIQQRVIVADMNGDGFADIVTLGSDSNGKMQVAIALGNGDGTFKAPVKTGYNAQYLPADALAVADFNADGKLDVATSGIFGAQDSGIALGNGDGTLQTITTTGGMQPAQSIYLAQGGAALAADFNGDGKPDLLIGTVLLLSQPAPPTGSAATHTALSVAPNPAAAGAAVTLTATVTSSVTGKPTGTVTFLDATRTLASTALSSQGTATFSTTSLAVGTHSLNAQYSGDTTFAASTASAVSLTVNTAAPGFAVTASPASGTAAAGHSLVTTVSIAPSGGFTGAVSLACSGLPTGAACSFSPSSVTVNGAAGTSTLTISSTMRTAQMIGAPAGRSLDPFVPAGTVLAGLAMPFLVRRRSQRRPRSTSALALAGLMLVCAGVLHGCGGGSSGMAGGTPAGTYSVTITATSGSTSHSASYSLALT